jgi:hypothetical protein
MKLAIIKKATITVYLLLSITMLTYTTAAEAPPAITVNPNTANPADTITIQGAGFAATRSITIRFSSLDITPSGISTNSSGAFTALVIVPNLSFGYYTINVTDSDGNSAISPFKVGAAWISLSKTSGYVGDNLSITGYSFTPDEPVAVKIENIDVTPSGATTDKLTGTGISFIVPTIASGIYTITVTEAQGGQATAPFMIQNVATDPSTSVSPTVSTSPSPTLPTTNSPALTDSYIPEISLLAVLLLLSVVTLILGLLFSSKHLKNKL